MKEHNGPTRRLHIITRMDKGGSAVHTAQIVRRLGPPKYEVHLIAGSLDQFSNEETEALRASCASFTVLPSLRRDPSPPDDLKALFQLRRIVRRGRFDIVHTHTSKAGFIGRIAARLAGARVVLHSTHGHVFYGYFSRLKTQVFIMMEKIAAHFCDRVLCLTQLEIEDHLKLGIGRRELFRVMISGVPVEKYFAPSKPREETRRTLGIPEGTPVIGVVARLEVVKGVRNLAEAMALLSGISPAPHLVVAGEGSERADIERIIEEKGLAGRVHLLGQREDVPDLLHAMDVYALPSLNEGYGRVIIEAMCAGLPVVATRVGGVPSLVRDGETGILIEPDDPAALAAGIERMLKDPALAARLAVAGRKAVTDEHSVDAALRTLDSLYDELLKEKSRR